MSIVPEHLPTVASPMPNRDETVALQIEKANLEREVDALRKELNFLDSFRSQASKLILATDKTKLTKLEKKVADYLEKSHRREKLKQELQKIQSDVAEGRQEASRVESRLSVLRAELKQIEVKQAKARNDIDEQLNEAHKELASVRDEIKEARAIRRQTFEEAEKERLEIAAERQKLQEEKSLFEVEKEALVRKQRDISIYERRVEKKFKELFPDQEMKFT